MQYLPGGQKQRLFLPPAQRRFKGDRFLSGSADYSPPISRVQSLETVEVVTSSQGLSFL